MTQTDTILPTLTAGLESLRRVGLVEPLGLSIQSDRWQFFKYKALPSHPKPGNAGQGWTHPAALNGIHAPGRVGFGRLLATDKEIMDGLLRPVAGALGFAGWEWAAQFARHADGTVSEVAILRGGALLFEEYPGSTEACPLVPAGDGNLEFQPASNELERLRQIRFAEKLSTTRFMQRLVDTALAVPA